MNRNNSYHIEPEQDRHVSICSDMFENGNNSYHIKSEQI